MTERELKLLLNANAIKRIQLHYAVMAQGYMIVADGNPLETSKRATRELKRWIPPPSFCSRSAWRILR